MNTPWASIIDLAPALYNGDPAAVLAAVAKGLLDAGNARRLEAIEAALERLSRDFERRPEIETELNSKPELKSVLLSGLEHIGESPFAEKRLAFESILHKLLLAEISIDECDSLTILFDRLSNVEIRILTLVSESHSFWSDSTVGRVQSAPQTGIEWLVVALGGEKDSASQQESVSLAIENLERYKLAPVGYSQVLAKRDSQNDCIYHICHVTERGHRISRILFDYRREHGLA